MGRLESRWSVAGQWRLHASVSVGPLPADRPPIVLVHGFVVSSRYLLPIAGQLARDFRVYLPDLPGFGLSEKPAYALNVSELADALAAWLRVVGLGPVTLLGNSFGCQVLAELAARYPEVVLRSERMQVGGDGLLAQVSVSVRDQVRTVPVPLRYEMKADELLVRGELRLRQTDIGLTPFSLLGGALRVEDEMIVKFSVLARAAP